MTVTINSKSRNGEVNNVATLILLDFSKRDFSDDSYLTDLIAKLTSNNELMTSVLKQQAIKSLLAEIDKKRDVILRVILHEVNIKKLWPVPPIKKAAECMAEQLDKFGFEVIDMAYSIESANIRALLEDLKKAEVAEAIKKLPGMPILTALLKEAQDEFEDMNMQQLKLQIKQKKTPTASELRELIRDQINNEIMIHLLAMSRSNPEKYKDCLEVVEEIIKINNQKVRNRGNNSDEDDQPEEI